MKRPYIKPEIHCVTVLASLILACSICDAPGNHYGHHKPHELEYEE